MKKRILVIDDDPGVQEIFKLIFEKAGYDTVILSGALPVLKDEFELPDLFVLDKQLSGTDGVDLCRHLKMHERTRSIPVIMISAAPDIDSLSLAAGADGYIEKPFMTKQLLETVEDALHKRLNNEPAITPGPGNS